MLLFIHLQKSTTQDFLETLTIFSEFECIWAAVIHVLHREIFSMKVSHSKSRFEFHREKKMHLWALWKFKVADQHINSVKLQSGPKVSGLFKLTIYGTSKSYFKNMNFCAKKKRLKIWRFLIVSVYKYESFSKQLESSFKKLCKINSWSWCRRS